jgi:hypothetical protein
MTVPKFKSRDEYEKWKAERLANPLPAVQQTSAQQDAAVSVDDSELEVQNKQIRNAWIAGVISGTVTLIFTILAANGHDLLGLGFDKFNYIDVVIIFGLSLGIYLKSRTCALLMLLYFVGSKIIIWQVLGKASGLVGAVLFGYYFVLGIIGTFNYRSIKVQNGNSTAWRPITITAVVMLLIGVLFFGKNFGLNSDLSSVLPGQTAAEWRDFTSPDGSFTIALPGDPIEKKETTKTAAGNMDMHLFTLDLRNISYAVIYTDFPPAFLQMPNAAEKLLEGGRNGAVAQVKGRLVSDQPISIGRHPGRELQIECSQGTILARIYIIDGRLYQMIVLTPTGKAISHDARKFLESFRVVSS